MADIASPLQAAYDGPIATLDQVADTASRLAFTAEERRNLDPLRASALMQLDGGELGEMLLAFLDAASNLGAGMTPDGTWIAKHLRALSDVSAASVVTALFAAARNGALAFDDRGQIGRSQGGARLDVLDADFPLAVTDEEGNLFAGIKDGKLYGPGSVTERHGGARNDMVTSYFNGVQVQLGDHNYDVAICDPAGHVMLGWMDGVFYAPIPSQDDALLDAQDAAAKSYSAAVYQRRVTTVQKPVAMHNALLIYGQSLAQGDETWPALSRSAVAGTLMLGGNTLSSADSSTFVQFTATGLQPLVAQTVSGATRYDAAGEAALAAGSGARGEPPNIGWARGAKLRLNDYLLVENDLARNLVTINVARSGATIGELEKGHSEGGTELYGKYSGALTQLVTAAGGSALCSTGLLFMQGEHDYSQASGHNSLNRTYATYRAKLEGLADDMQADAIAATGQAKPPAFLLYQTGAAYTRDVDADGTPGLHIGMAQLDVALSRDTAWMVGPVYPYTDKGGHLDSNGSRWFGHLVAKVWHQVVVEGRDWEPLRPIRIWSGGSNIIYVAYHVPFGPLVFDEPQLAGGTEYSATSKGFRVTDAGGSVTVTNAEIVRDTIIKLTCSRAIGATPMLWYASQAATGNGMVRDSDPSIASDRYVYEPERGMYATANIPQFVNKPYPLPNWSVAFYLPVEI